MDILGIVFWCEILWFYQMMCGLVDRYLGVMGVVLVFLLLDWASHVLQFQRNRFANLDPPPKCIVAIIIGYDEIN